VRAQAGVPWRRLFRGRGAGRCNRLLMLAAALCVCSTLVACRPAEQSATGTVAITPEQNSVAPRSRGPDEGPAESSFGKAAALAPAGAADTPEVALRSDAATAATRRAARPLRPGAMNDITFDDLELDMPVGTLFNRSLLTPRAAQLDGQKIRIRGFIFAGGVFQQSGITSFPFVKNTQCKFGPQGLAFCVMLVDLDAGVTTDFTTYPVTVEGTLTVRPYDSDGFTWSVYHVQAQRVY
jgi:hypothetical protein